MDKQVICDYCLKIAERTNDRLSRITYDKQKGIVSIIFKNEETRFVNVRNDSEIRAGSKILAEIEK